MLQYWAPDAQVWCRREPLVILDHVADFCCWCSPLLATLVQGMFPTALTRASWRNSYPSRIVLKGYSWVNDRLVWMFFSSSLVIDIND
jgi:hypothetical protein